MRKKNTLILLFMLVFSGATLLGYTPAWADAPVDVCNFPTEEGLCVNIYKDDKIAYVVRAVLKNGHHVTPSDVCDKWPYQEGGVGPWIFKYEVGPTEGAVNKDPQVSAVSYVLTRLRDLPLPGSDPPGAQLDVTQIHYACLGVEPITPITPITSPFIAYKWNASVNNKTSDTIEIHAPSPQIDSHGYAWVLFKSDCDGGPLLLPQLGEPAPFEQFRSFFCEDSGITVTVEYEQCFGGVVNVSCNGDLVPPEDITDDIWGYATVPTHPDPDLQARSFQITNMGPGASGVTVCTGSENEPVFLRGDRAWWCGGPPGE